MSGFDYFVKYLFPPVILIFGLNGNIIAIVVLLRKRFDSIGPRFMMIYLFLVDTVYLLQISFNYSANAFQKDFALISTTSCKIYFFINYSLDAVSSFLLVYISFDRYVSIRFISLRDFFRRKKSQLIYFLIVLAYNLLLNIPVILFTELKTSKYNANHTNKTPFKYCTFSESSWNDTILLINTINRIILPYTLIVITSIMLVYHVIRVEKNFASMRANSTNLDMKDVRFVSTAVTLNLVYIALNLPAIVVYGFPNNLSVTIYQFTLYLFYVCYGINFYLMLLANRAFRNEFFEMLYKYKSKTRTREALTLEIVDRTIQ